MHAVRGNSGRWLVRHEGLTDTVLWAGQTAAAARLGFATCMTLVWLAAGLASSAYAEAPGCSCRPSAAVTATLKAIDGMGRGLHPVERRAIRLRALEALQREYPGDLFVERRYQDTVRGEKPYDAETREKYRRLATEHPSDPIYLYLYGRVLALNGDRSAAEYFERALDHSPDCPWPHFALASLHDLDPDKVRMHLAQFMRLCPDNLEPYPYLQRVKDVAFLQHAASVLRQRLSADAEPQDLVYYKTLWLLDLRLASSSERAEVRRRILEDCSRIRQGSVALDRAVGLDTLEEGYRLAEDADGIGWAKSQIVTRFPTSQEALRIFDQRWDAQHPRPTESVKPEQGNTYYLALLRFADDRIGRSEDDVEAWSMRLDAINHLKDVPASEVTAAADGILRCMDRTAANPQVPPLQMRVAMAYLRHGLRIDQVPKLVSAGIDDLDSFTRMWAQPSGPLLINLDGSKWTGWPLMASAYLRTGEIAAAQGVLDRMEDWLVAHQPPGAAGSVGKLSSEDGGWYEYGRREYLYWNGRLAEVRGSKLDAVGFYREAVSLTPPNGPAADEDPSDSAASRLSRLWTSLGGSAQGLQALVAAEPSPTNSKETALRLPDFDLPDLTGHRWSLQELDHKVAVVNVWATWCTPCMAELPFLQKVYDQLKSRSDVVVLALNIDENEAVVEPFMREHGFSFPVVPAAAYVRQFAPALPIPQNWIVLPDGRIAAEVPFAGDGDDWLGRMTASVRGVATEH